MCCTNAWCTHVHIQHTHSIDGSTYVIHTPVLSHSLRVLNAPTANSSPNEQYGQWKRMHCVVSHLTAISYTVYTPPIPLSLPCPSAPQLRTCETASFIPLSQAPLAKHVTKRSTRSAAGAISCEKKQSNG